MRLSYQEAKEKLLSGKLRLLSQFHGDKLVIFLSEELDFGWLFVATYDEPKKRHFNRYHTFIVDCQYGIVYWTTDADSDTIHDIRVRRKNFFFRLMCRVISFFEDLDLKRNMKP
jgi:hypothetical protein